MLDPRIYRAGFLPAVAAFVALLFSLQSAPEPIEGPLPPELDGRETTRLARSLAAIAPERAPGSPGDAQLAAWVREGFEAVPGGAVSTQEIDASWEGEEVNLENVLLTLPGELEEVLLVVAARDSVEGPGAASSAAATATLLALAEDLGGTRHSRTIVLASTSGLALGAAGVRELVSALPAPAGIDVAVVLAHPGREEGEPPYVHTPLARPSSPPPQLLTSGEEIASVRFERDDPGGGGWSDFARLAFPAGIGEATALHAEGVAAIAVTAGGERPPAPEHDTALSLSRESMTAAGGTALELILTLDGAGSAALGGGPSTYVRIGDNLLPGWTLTLLGVGLIVPALLAAGDVFLRDRRRDRRAARRAIPWTLERIMLPLSGLLLLYVLGFVGLLSGADFPYDPARFPPGGEAVAVAVAIALAVGVTALLIRPLRTPLDAEPQTLAAAAGLLLGASAIGLWLTNPFLGLLVAPLAHLWLLPARTSGPPRRMLIAVTAVILLLPALAAAATVAGALGLGLEGPWHLLLLIEAGQIGLLQSLFWCGLLGGVLSCVAAAGAEAAATPLPAAPRAESIRGPAGHAGPGSLGGVPSSGGGARLPRR